MFFFGIFAHFETTGPVAGRPFAANFIIAALD